MEGVQDVLIKRNPDLDIRKIFIEDTDITIKVMSVAFLLPLIG